MNRASDPEWSALEGRIIAWDERIRSREQKIKILDERLRDLEQQLGALKRRLANGTGVMPVQTDADPG
jgi:predicted  nucleic acid-binding Zn-ribbon protein